MMTSPFSARASSRASTGGHHGRYQCHDVHLFCSGIIARLDGVRTVGGDYATAFESYLLNAEGTALRFPTDDEFSRAIALRDAADWDAATPIGRALAAGESVPLVWAYPSVDERTRAIYRASR